MAFIREPAASLRSLKSLLMITVVPRAFLLVSVKTSFSAKISFLAPFLTLLKSSIFLLKTLLVWLINLLTFLVYFLTEIFQLNLLAFNLSSLQILKTLLSLLERLKGYSCLSQRPTKLVLLQLTLCQSSLLGNRLVKIHLRDLQVEVLNQKGFRGSDSLKGLLLQSLLLLGLFDVILQGHLSNLLGHYNKYILKEFIMKSKEGKNQLKNDKKFRLIKLVFKLEPLEFGVCY